LVQVLVEGSPASEVRFLLFVIGRPVVAYAAAADGETGARSPAAFSVLQMDNPAGFDSSIVFSAVLQAISQQHRSDVFVDCEHHVAVLINE
jgi:hypothetical protein